MKENCCLTTKFWNSSNVVASVSHWEVIADMLFLSFTFEMDSIWQTSLYNLWPIVSFPSYLSRNVELSKAYSHSLMLHIQNLPEWNFISIAPKLLLTENRSISFTFSFMVNVRYGVILLQRQTINAKSLKAAFINMLKRNQQHIWFHPTFDCYCCMLMQKSEH